MVAYGKVIVQFGLLPEPDLEGDMRHEDVCTEAGMTAPLAADAPDTPTPSQLSMCGYGFADHMQHIQEARLVGGGAKVSRDEINWDMNDPARLPLSLGGSERRLNSGSTGSGRNLTLPHRPASEGMARSSEKRPASTGVEAAQATYRELKLEIGMLQQKLKDTEEAWKQDALRHKETEERQTEELEHYKTQFVQFLSEELKKPGRVVTPEVSKDETQEPQSPVKILRDTFQSFTATQPGGKVLVENVKVSEDFKSILERFDLIDTNLQEAVVAMDVSKDGEIDFEEFQHAVNKRLLRYMDVNVAKLEELFKKVYSVSEKKDSPRTQLVSVHARVRLNLDADEIDTNWLAAVDALDRFLRIYGLTIDDFQGKGTGDTSLGAFEGMIAERLDRIAQMQWLMKNKFVETVAKILPRGKRGDPLAGIRALTERNAGKELRSFDIFRFVSAAYNSLMAIDTDWRTVLHHAALQGDIQKCRELMSQGGTMLTNMQDVGRCTALHLAAQNGHVEICRLMVENAGPELIMMQTKDLSSCAHLAARHGHASSLRALLEIGGEDLAMLVDSEGHSCATIAAEKGYVEVLKVALKYGGKDLAMQPTTTGMTCALLAVQNGHTEALKEALKVGGKDLAMAVQMKRMSCAVLACQKGHLEALIAVLEVGGKDLVMLQNVSGTSCAFIACQQNQLSCLKAVLAVGGKDLSMLVKKSKMSCAMIACQKGHIEALKEVLGVGGKDLAMIADENGYSCAYAAVENGQLDALREVFKVGGKDLAMLTTKDGWSCASIACYFGRVDALKATLAVGGRDLALLLRNDGWTCALIAAQNGHLEALNLVLEVAGKELVLMVTDDKFSVALIASQKGQTEILKVALAVGGKDLAMLQTNTGASCAFLACQKGHVDALKVVLDVAGKDVAMLTKNDGTSCAHIASANGNIQCLKMVVEVGGKDLVMTLTKAGETCLMVGQGHVNVCDYLAQFGGHDLIKISDAGSWTILHRLIFCGEEQLAAIVAGHGGNPSLDVLLLAHKDVNLERVAEDMEMSQSLPFVFRGFPSMMNMDVEMRTIAFRGMFCSFRSRGGCPVGSRAYYELEIITLDTAPQYGFCEDRFERVKGWVEEGVGDDDFGWAVDGVRGFFLHNGPDEYNVVWKQGDVIGLACDLVDWKLHVSVNGSFDKSNGVEYDLGKNCCERLYAAFSCQSGIIRYNMGEDPFKYGPPSNAFVPWNGLPL